MKQEKAIALMTKNHSKGAREAADSAIKDVCHQFSLNYAKPLDDSTRKWLLETITESIDQHTRASEMRALLERWVELIESGLADRFIVFNSRQVGKNTVNNLLSNTKQLLGGIKKE